MVLVLVVVVVVVATAVRVVLLFERKMIWSLIRTSACFCCCGVGCIVNTAGGAVVMLLLLVAMVIVVVVVEDVVSTAEGPIPRRFVCSFIAKIILPAAGVICWATSPSWGGRRGELMGCGRVRTAAVVVGVMSIRCVAMSPVVVVVCGVEISGMGRGGKVVLLLLLILLL